MQWFKNKSPKFRAFVDLLVFVVLLLMLNSVLSNHFFRIDLTKEKRYSLSPASKKLAARIKETMYVQVYLEGEFPAGFKRLRQSTREMLDEFRAYSDNKLQYEFIDPFKHADEKKTVNIIQELGAKGLQPTNIQLKRDDEFSQKIIIPGAIVHYKGVEYPLNLLKSQFGAAPEETINSSIELLEYEIDNIVRKATETQVKKIGFLQGHGELSRWDIAEAKAQLEMYYAVEDIDLPNVPAEKLREYAGIIIAKPLLPFTDYDKFKLDQYIMHGGKTMWFVETQLAEMDSLYSHSMFLSIAYPHKLEDMLFSYGVRLNPTIVQDLRCNAIPVLSGMNNGSPQQKLLPWMYYPVIAPQDNHPIVKNLDPIWLQFAASMDTLSKKGQHKTILLQSSDYSRAVPGPARVDITIARLNPEPELFRGKGHLITGVLLEGNIESIFRYRWDAKQDPSLDFKPFIEQGKMIVVSDGDVLKNQFKRSSGEVFPLGYDRYSNQQFGNAKFLLNCVDYLCDDSGIIDVRAKELAVSLLDKGRVKKEKWIWQCINLALPVVFIVLFGLLNQIIRKKKYQ